MSHGLQLDLEWEDLWYFVECDGDKDELHDGEIDELYDDLHDGEIDELHDDLRDGDIDALHDDLRDGDIDALHDGDIDALHDGDIDALHDGYFLYLLLVTQTFFLSAGNLTLQRFPLTVSYSVSHIFSAVHLCVHFIFLCFLYVTSTS
jgi:hypothetical protein